MIRRFLVVLALGGVVLAACSGDSTSTEDQVTEEPTPQAETPTTDAAVDDSGSFIARDGDTVEVHYVGTLDDGSEFDSSRERGSTFTFVVGSGQVISGFDEAVRGGQVGDVRTSRMEAKDAYGEWSEDNLVVVPFNPEQGDVKAGDQVYLTNGQPALVVAW